MRKFTQMVFDDFVAPAATTFYTRSELNDMLGQFDKLAIQSVTDQVNATGTITIRIQHSADQLNWSNKAGTAEINAQAVTTTVTNVSFGYDAGTTPTLGYARLAISLTTTAQAHVRLWVTARDDG